MRSVIAIAAVAALACGAPALSQTAPQTTSSLVLSCIERMEAENDLTETDLYSLQTDRWYSVYGERYQLRAGGTAADICRLAVAERQGEAYDEIVADFRAETVRANGLQTENSILRGRLDQYERPLGISDPRFVEAYQWVNANAILGWALSAIFFAYILGHLWSMTPWHRHAMERARARRARRLHRTFSRI